MNIIVFHGNDTGRACLLEHEFYFADPSTGERQFNRSPKLLYKFNVSLPCVYWRASVGKEVVVDSCALEQVLVTTFEVILKEPALAAVEWQCLIVDEAHRLKNDAGRLGVTLRSFHRDHCLLLTGLAFACLLGLLLVAAIICWLLTRLPWL